MTDRSSVRLWLTRAALTGCVLMAAIIVTSAYLRLTTMGIGCEPWPACYGRIQPPAASAQIPAAADRGVTIARLLHRAAAMLVAILAVFTLLLSLMRAARSPVNVALALGVLTLTVVLAAVGRMSATLLVPAVGVANLLGGFGMLACFWALRLNNVARSRSDGMGGNRLRRVAAGVLLVFVVQAAAGALISVTYSAALCPSLWVCDGSDAAPAHRPTAPDLLAAQPIDASGKVIAAPAWGNVQTMHRLSGVVAAALFFLLGVWAATMTVNRTLGIGVLGLGLIEAGIGVLMATRDFPLAAAMAHNTVAAMLLLMLVTLAWPNAPR